MKKNVTSKLRELSKHIPPVVEFIPVRVIKSGAELNGVIEAEKQKQYDALPWYEKIKLATIEHGMELGLVETPTPIRKYNDEKTYTQKRKAPKLVNHYKNLKREWELNGQQGITDYAIRMKQINELQNKKHATNPTQQTP